MCSHHAEASDQTANAQVDKHALLAVSGAYPEGDKDAADDDDPSVGEEAGSNDKMLHLLYVGNCTLVRCVQNNDDRPNDAHEAAHFADKAESLLQKDGG